jgi:hypothetical protein
LVFNFYDSLPDDYNIQSHFFEALLNKQRLSLIDPLSLKSETARLLILTYDRKPYDYLPLVMRAITKEETANKSWFNSRGKSAEEWLKKILPTIITPINIVLVLATIDGHYVPKFFNNPIILDWIARSLPKITSPLSKRNIFNFFDRKKDRREALEKNSDIKLWIEQVEKELPKSTPSALIEI